jgi:hypothetical protein
MMDGMAADDFSVRSFAFSTVELGSKEAPSASGPKEQTVWEMQESDRPPPQHYFLDMDVGVRN